MKDLIELCAAEIAKCEESLKPYFEKYSVTSSFKLLTQALGDDYAGVLALVHRKDSFVTLVNGVLAKYDTPNGSSDYQDSDVDKKRRGVFSVAQTVFERAIVPNIATWSRLDGIPTSRHAEQVTQCIMAGDLELATFGLMYLIYQKTHPTNVADAKVEQVLLATTPSQTPPQPPEAA